MICKKLMQGAAMLILFNYFQVMDVSAYTPHENGGNRMTASGVEAIEGVTVACDHLPFGTQVIIMGKVYTVQDRFGGGYGNKLDIFMENLNSVYSFGRRTLNVEILS